jgi:hypothetical protein
MNNLNMFKDFDLGAKTRTGFARTSGAQGLPVAENKEWDGDDLEGQLDRLLLFDRPVALLGGTHQLLGRRLDQRLNFEGYASGFRV